MPADTFNGDVPVATYTVSDGEGGTDEGTLTLTVDVATTGADTDIAVRVVDIDEDGDPMLIGEGIQRLTARVDERTARCSVNDARVHAVRNSTAATSSSSATTAAVSSRRSV